MGDVEKAPTIAAPARSPDSVVQDLPVAGTAGARALSGRGFDAARPLRFIWRPPSLRGADDAFAFYVEDESMEPEFHAGQIYLAQPGRPLRMLAPVVVVHRDASDRPAQASLGLYNGEDDGKLQLVKRNPKHGQRREWIVAIPLTQVETIASVIANSEIFGA